MKRPGPTRFTGIAVAILTGVLIACGAEPTGIDNTEDVSIAGPASYRFIAFGQAIQVALDSGDPAAASWRTTSPDVVAVTSEATGATFEAVGNGTALVIAQLSGESDTIMVSVEQEARTLALSLHPLAAEVNQGFRLQAVAVDSLGSTITSATGTLTASLTSSTAAALSGSVSFDLDQGVGTGESLIIDAPGTGFTLRVEGNVSAPGGMVNLTSRSTPPFEVFAAGQGPTGTSLGSGSWELLAAQTVVDERLHQLLTVIGTLPSTLNVAPGDRLMFRLRDMSRQSQGCTSDNLLESECALVDWSSQPGGINTPESGVFLNRVEIANATGTERWFLRSGGGLSDVPEPFVPG